MRNYFIRLAFSFAILTTALIIIMNIFPPNASDDNLSLTFAVLVAIIISLCLTYLEFVMLIRPIKKLNDASKKIINGDFSTRVTFTNADSDVIALTKSINNIANEFENLEEMRRTFVANASHEMRSPLTSMQGFLQALLDGTITDPADHDKYLNIVLSETKRLSGLINSMLDLSRMESGRYPLNPSRFEINDVIRQIVERFQPTLMRRELQLDVDFARDTTYVFADKDKIIQVIINLIDNAIKYSPAYSRIFVSTHIHNRKLYVTVKDKGYGINKKDQLLIWDKFYMSDKARTPSKGKGTGLGLSIVKKIIDDHKEIVWVESTKGQGATFIFTLSLFDPNKHKIVPPSSSTPTPPISL